MKLFLLYYWQFLQNPHKEDPLQSNTNPQFPLMTALILFTKSLSKYSTFPHIRVYICSGKSNSIQSGNIFLIFFHFLSFSHLHSCNPSFIIKKALQAITPYMLKKRKIIYISGGTYSDKRHMVHYFSWLLEYRDFFSSIMNNGYGSLYNLYVAWSKNDYGETPEEMAAILYNIHHPSQR